MNLKIKKKNAATVREKGADAAWEKPAIKKVRFSENLCKIFPKADEILGNQKIHDDFPEITIPNTQTMFKELNGQKILEGLKSFLEEITLAMLNIGMLNKSNEHF